MERFLMIFMYNLWSKANFLYTALIEKKSPKNPCHKKSKKN